MTRWTSRCVRRSDTWYFLRIRPYVAPNGIDGVVLTMVDITKLKEAQVRLLELSEIVEHSDDAIYRVDLSGRIRTWNKGAVNLFGFSAEEVVGQSDSMLCPADYAPEADECMHRISEGKAMDRLETIRKKKSGQTFDVALTISPIRNHRGEVDGASVIARDMTRQRRAVQQRDQFLATLSHELRNPFAAILNASSLLKESELDEETEQEARDLISVQLEHISLLLDDLLDVARFTNGKLIDPSRADQRCWARLGKCSTAFGIASTKPTNASTSKSRTSPIYVRADSSSPAASASKPAGQCVQVQSPAKRDLVPHRKGRRGGRDHGSR